MFKDRIVVRKGIEFQSMKTEDVAYFYTEHKLVFLVDKDGKNIWPMQRILLTFYPVK